MSSSALVRAGVLAAIEATVARRPQAAQTPGIRLTRHRIAWPVERAIRVAHITDLHVGWTTPERILRAARDTVAAAHPDVVVLTGDYLNHSLRHAQRLRDFVAALPGERLATLGNHDYWSGAGGVADALRAGGVGLLVNRHRVVGPAQNRLTVVGVDDGFTGNDDPARAFRGAARRRDALVLSHDPAVSDRIAAEGGRLILSGHTHGGQFHVPGVTDRFLRAAGVQYVAGWYRVGRARLYVNAGIGVSVEGLRRGEPARVEIAVFDLVPR